jgi:hypothetical protein
LTGNYPRRIEVNLSDADFSVLQQGVDYLQLLATSACERMNFRPEEPIEEPVDQNSGTSRKKPRLVLLRRNEERRHRVF